MNQPTGFVLALVVMATLLPGAAHGQKGKKPSNNMWTRSASLYLQRARENPRPEEKRALYQEALTAALESAANDASNPRGWFLAGSAYLKLGDYAGADSAFDRAESLYPEYTAETEVERHNAWVLAYNAGVTALQGGQLEDAVAQFRRADHIYQKRPEARMNLGAVQARAGNTDEAIASYRSALELLRSPERKGLNEKQEAEWRESEEIAAFNLAQLLAAAGRDEEAVQAYREFLAREPDNVPARANLGIVLARQGRKAEATEVYRELLARGDLGHVEYFNVGIGLFQAEQYEQSAEAFRKALALNPYSRDAVYNLAQALYARSLDAEEEVKSAAKGAAQKKKEGELSALYEELRQAGDRLIGIDPYNRNVLLLAARAYRGLADRAGDAGTADELRRKTLALLERHESMPFEVDDLKLTGEGTSFRMTGKLTNLKLAPGTPIKLRVTFLGKTGTPAGAQEVTVVAPAAENATDFELSFEAKEPVAGWKYEAAQ
ncbi:MAG: tetratricopeptide repeat protein [Gemmatimonadetes bacterium]|nr:tetratricopeptide repeat protein [Gemmatimonadota bacterium]